MPGWAAPRAGASATAYGMPASPLETLRHALAMDPVRNLGQLDTLREQAILAKDDALLLRVDDLACRALSDLDQTKALAVAQAGLARSAKAPRGPAYEAWLRLRVCRASTLLGTPQRSEGEQELAEIVALAPPGTPAWAMARLERGVDRSRRSDWAGAQDDLVAACEALQELPDQRDQELCLGQLGNHYRRVGDTDEAQRLLAQMQETFLQRGEDYDASIHAYNLAIVHVERQHWDEALQSALVAERASTRLNDVLGQGFAGRVIAMVLMHQGQLPQALARVELARQQVDPQADGRERTYLDVLHAELLARTGRPGDALTALEGLRPAVALQDEHGLDLAWKTARAAALAGLGNWREAYEARTEAANVAETIHRLRLTDQAARLGKQFNRARDAKALSVLRQLNERERELRQTQAVALVLFAGVLLAVVVLAVRKILQVRRLQRLATTDELTGLMNRRALMDHAGQMQARSQRHGWPMAVLMVDIDHFKRINDTHGHPVGDVVLRHVAGVIDGALRAGDQLGRYGGEEFVALLGHAGRDDALRVAQRMREAIARQPPPLASSGQTLNLTISVGLAVREPDEGVEGLLARADAGLYRAKSAGRDRVAD